MAELGNSMSRNSILAGALCGIFAPIIFLICYSIAWALSPWYIFGGHYLSDLGVHEGALAFNTGAVVAGTLAIPFALTLWRLLPTTRLSSLGCFFLGASSAALVGVGVFSEDFGIVHFAFTVLFFLISLLAQLSLAWPLVRSSEFRIVGVVVTILMLATLVVLAPIGANPLGETIAVMEILIWALIVATQTLRVVTGRAKV